MGGECNYLLRVNPTTYRLEFVPEEAWQTPEMLSWDEDDIKVGGGGRWVDLLGSQSVRAFCQGGVMER